MKLRWGFLGCAVVAGACHLYSSSDNVAPDAPVDAGAVLGSAACGVGCLPKAPAGWSGPSTILPVDLEAGAPDCPLQFPMREPDSMLVDAAASAGCDCAPTVVNGKCSYTVKAFNSPSCGTLLGTSTVEGLCHAFPANTQGFEFTGGFVATGNGCLATTASALPAVDEQQLVSCSQRESTQCAGHDGCVAVEAPSAPFVRVCIHTDGDVACPSASYPNKVVSYTSVHDGRSCAACTASPPATDPCDFFASTAANCGAGGNLQHDGGGCHAAVFAVDVGTTLHADAGCTVTGGGVTGSVDVASPVTYCCTN